MVIAKLGGSTWGGRGFFRRSNDELIIRLCVAPEDMGKVIGKQGRIARAIRTVVRASAVRGQKKVNVEIME